MWLFTEPVSLAKKMESYQLGGRHSNKPVLSVSQACGMLVKQGTKIEENRRSKKKMKGERKGKKKDTQANNYSFALF